MLRERSCVFCIRMGATNPWYRWNPRNRSPIAALEKGKLTVSVKDRQGNTTRIERSFSVVPPGTR
jgi:hypothetical protein